MSVLLLLSLVVMADSPEERPRVIVVVGASGTPEYGKAFERWANRWRTAAEMGAADVIRIGADADESTTDHDRLHQALDAGVSGQSPLWLVLIGHGTFDGREAKFNLRGPDVSDVELAGWLAPIKRPVVVIDCASSSGSFINRLSGANRVVVTATRSGHEQNYARFGEYISESIADPKADLDKDGQVSVLEAFLSASARVDEYYKTRSQLATEHALIDDNGDKLGTPHDWFRGVRATRRARDGAALDGLRARQIHLILGERERQLSPEVRRKRDTLELAIAALRDLKEKLPPDEYDRRLEPILVELAKLYRDAQASSIAPSRAQ